MLNYLGQRLIGLQIELKQAICGAGGPRTRGLGSTLRLGHSPIGHRGDPNPQNEAGWINVRKIRGAIEDVEKQIYRITVGPFPEQGLESGFQLERSPMGSSPEMGLYPARTIADDLDDFSIGGSALGE